MQLADKPYAELMEAAKSEKFVGDELVGLLKAARVLPPDRAAMMLAAFGVYLYGVATGAWRVGVPARAAVSAFIEEARWRSL